MYFISSLKYRVLVTPLYLTLCLKVHSLCVDFFVCCGFGAVVCMIKAFIDLNISFGIVISLIVLYA